MSAADRLVQDLNILIESTVSNITTTISKVPGSAIVIRYVQSSYQNDPARSVLELLLLLFAVRYFLASKYSYNKKNYVRLTEDEVEELIEDWTPEPLIKPITELDQKNIDDIPIIETHNGPIVKLQGHNGREFLNLTSTDVYNFNNNDRIKQEAIRSVRKHGVGSCGPAGFYGHQDAHWDCERALSDFLGTERSILYSQGFATSSSVIPCFLKRGDVIIADDKINLGIQKGMQLSRASVFWYEHNNMEELEKVMILANKKKQRGPIPRRFLITEGIYETEGDSPDLATMIKLKHKYKYRLLIDESWSFGILGDHGKGLPEQLGIDRKEIDITLGVLASAFGSAGGFCTGETAMVEHQRITSLAYTFSATMPAYLANSTTAVINWFFKDDEWRAKNFTSIRHKSRLFRDIIAESKFIDMNNVDNSPMFILRIAEPILDRKLKSISDKAQEALEIEALLQLIVDECLSEGVLISRQKVLPEFETFPVDRAIKVTISNDLTDDQVQRAARTIVNSFRVKLQ
ncbi:serine C-palmitoyltransferase LCB1 [Sugiyamaella lignohabitans]|uniref:serine C-palmitoyltransferase n=1 Tax=Sugiyamaella lignohabitans TaxID=796027 RepID=A0A167DL08_9ASCO|nr:serine C-palmitoyltransferase LCB1 [Sugiyamaella lignohabitans]ANB13029.1 serine C-palmitoyltransferase LCB1 [Sugiyamaella lignohabitans]